MFLPLLYSVVFPNNDLRGIVYALEERGAAPAKAADIVKETLATAGPGWVLFRGHGHGADQRIAGVKQEAGFLPCVVSEAFQAVAARNHARRGRREYGVLH